MKVKYQIAHTMTTPRQGLDKKCHVSFEYSGIIYVNPIQNSQPFKASLELKALVVKKDLPLITRQCFNFLYPFVSG